MRIGYLPVKLARLSQSYKQVSLYRVMHISWNTSIARVPVETIQPSSYKDTPNLAKDPLHVQPESEFMKSKLDRLNWTSFQQFAAHM